MAGSRRQWGWHELRPEWAERVVDLAGVRRGDLVLDIGAGRGALTAPLLERGARVIAVELQPDRAAFLRARFGDKVVVVEHDAVELRLPGHPYRVVASPPYSLTSRLLTRLLHPHSRLVSAHLVVQRQAAERWTSPFAPAANRWRRSFDASLPMAVPRRAFTPPPRVDNRVLALRRRK